MAYLNLPTSKTPNDTNKTQVRQYFKCQNILSMKDENKKMKEYIFIYLEITIALTSSVRRHGGKRCDLNKT